MDDFSEVYTSYYHRVHRFLRSLTGSEQQADELVQEVFYKALLHINRYNETGNMFTWLCTIGKNAWLNECRKRKQILPLEPLQDSLPDTSLSPEDTLLQKERVHAMREAILTLPEEQRDVVILHVYGSIPLCDIAKARGRSESWGKVTFYRAKSALAKKIGGIL